MTNGKADNDVPLIVRCISDWKRVLKQKQRIAELKN
jgi:hypothetical protein